MNNNSDDGSPVGLHVLIVMLVVVLVGILAGTFLNRQAQRREEELQKIKLIEYGYAEYNDQAHLPGPL